jgi:hypothetical protein
MDAETTQETARAAAERRAVYKRARKARRTQRIATLKGLGYRPNRRLMQCKRTGRLIVGAFVDGSAVLDWVLEPAAEYLARRESMATP